MQLLPPTCSPLLVLRRWLSGVSPMPSRKMFLMVSLAGFLRIHKDHSALKTNTQASSLIPVTATAMV